MKQLLDVSPDGILVTDTAGRFARWNRRLEEIWNPPPALLEAGRLEAFRDERDEPGGARLVLPRLFRPAQA